jgi:hypothetical protein
MNWSSLLPSTIYPDVALKRLFDADHNIATHGLRDVFIFLTFGIAAVFAICVMWQTCTSCFRTEQYLSLMRDGKQAADVVGASNLAFFRELIKASLNRVLFAGRLWQNVQTPDRRCGGSFS